MKLKQNIDGVNYVLFTIDLTSSSYKVFIEKVKAYDGIIISAIKINWFFSPTLVRAKVFIEERKAINFSNIPMK